jgi:hypothetical protein
MTNTDSRPWSSGPIALIALLFSIVCSVARAGDIAPSARIPFPASNASARADMYFRLHADVRAAATTIALPGRGMTDGAAMRPLSDCTGRATATVVRRNSVPYRLQSASTDIADAVGPASFTRTP